MRASACILVLLVLVAARGRHREPAASSDEGMRKRLAGVWVYEHESASGQDIVDTLEVTPGGTFADVHSFPKRKRGPRRIEDSGTWRIEDGVLIATVTSSSQTNAQVPEEWRQKSSGLTTAN